MSKKKIGTIIEAPLWMVDNKYLLSGYRLNFNSFKCAVKSLFIKHNELMNVWTHLIGALIFVTLLVIVCGYSSAFLRQFNSVFFPQYKSFVNQDSGWRAMYLTKTKDLLKKIPGLLNQPDLVSQILEVSRANKDKLLDNIAIFLQDVKWVIPSGDMDLYSDLKGEYLRLEANLDRFLGLLSSFQRNVISNISTVNSSASRLVQYLHVHCENLMISFEDTITLEKQFLAQFGNLQPLSKTPVIIFLLTAFFCLSSSVVFHLFYPISLVVFKILHRLDMAGISILNFGSSFAMFYYYFHCDPILQRIYSIVIGVFCAIVFTVSMGETIHKPSYLRWKSLMYAGLGLSNLVPIVHIIVFCCRANAQNRHIPLNSTLILLALMATLYLVGLVFYTYRIPERFWPNVFDIWFNSHTIWHLFVFAAAVTHFGGVIMLFNARVDIPCA